MPLTSDYSFGPSFQVQIVLRHPSRSFVTSHLHERSKYAYLFNACDPNIKLVEHLLDAGAPSHGGSQVPLLWHVPSVAVAVAVAVAVLFLFLQPGSTSLGHGVRHNVEV